MMQMRFRVALCVAILLCLNAAAPAADTGKGSDTNLAQQANNPIANMISVPFQLNANKGVGPRDQDQNVLTIQPVIPFELNQDWLLVSRWILPLIDQPDFVKGSGRINGTGDLNAAFFFSPSSRLTGLPDEWVVGFGPGIQAPTASNSQLGSDDKWGLGPTALAVYTKDKWVMGALISNTWSLGDGGDEINAFLFEPFVTYNITDEWYVISDSVITADWNASSSERWVVPIGGGFGKTFTIGKQAVNTNLQAYWNASDTTFGPDWNLVANFQLLFPK
ncbi:MAG: neuromedin U [Gammaproteobacteria bacterium]